jgi:hypothetical protein
MQADGNFFEQPRNQATKAAKLCSFVALLLNHSALRTRHSALERLFSGFQFGMDDWGNWRLPVAERRDDNSPAIYGWVKRQSNGKVPQGRQNASFVPDGTLEICGSRVPAINGWAIFTERGTGRGALARCLAMTEI